MQQPAQRSAGGGRRFGRHARQVVDCMQHMEAHLNVLRVCKFCVEVLKIL